MKISAIILARMGSSRLPGKVLMDLQGKPVLQRVIERCQDSKTKDVIVATPPTNKENPIWDLCKKLGVEIFKGSENNVMERTYLAAKQFNVDLIIDVTSDCPLIDPKIIDKLVGYKVDYASNVIHRAFPAGFDCQVYTFDAFHKLFEMSKTDDRIITEHSGWNFTKLLKEFTHYSLVPFPEYRYPKWRLTLDTRKDYELINWLYSVMGEEIWGCRQIIKFLRSNIKDFIAYDSMADQACWASSH